MTRALYLRNLPTQIQALFPAAAAGAHPPADIEVDEWAEANIYLSHRVTARTGYIRLEVYQRDALRAIRRWPRVVLVWGTQTGKTVIMQCFLGWCAAERPGPTMYSGPDREFVARRSRRHLQPIFQDSPVLKRLIGEDRHDFQLFQYNLTTCNVTLAWAGSPSQMAGEPIMNLGRDEFDKWRDSTDKESNSFRLIERRVGSFGRQARIMDATTPTVEEAEGWRALLGGTYAERYIPCPHCATAPEPFTGTERNRGWQVLHIERFRYPPRLRAENGDPEELCDWQVRIRKATAYECCDCGALITEQQRWGCIMRSVEVCRHPGADYYSSHLPGWYARSDYNNFGNTAARNVEGLEDDQAAQDFANSDAARPYQRNDANASLDLVAAHCSDDYILGQIPTSDPLLLIATADIHARCHHWTVWALTRERTYLVDLGKIETESLQGLLDIRQRTYATEDGTQYAVEALFPDASYRPDEVVDLSITDEYILPITGQLRSGLVKTSTWETYPGSNRDLPHPIEVMHCNDQYYKEQLLRRYEHGRQEDGSFDLAQSDWVLPRDTSREFLRHLLGASVVKVKDNKGVESTELRKTGPDHFLDCAKYALAVRSALRPKLLALGKTATVSAGPRVTGTKPDGWDQ